MLTLRSHQVEALACEVDRSNVEVLRERVRSSAPDLLSSPLGPLDPLLLLTVQKGRALGIRTIEAHLVLFRFVSRVGPDFDRHPVVRAALEDDTLPPDGRLAPLLALAPLEVWREACR